MSLLVGKNFLHVVNSLVSDHPWCTTKWSLTGGSRLWEKLRKKTQTELIDVITLSYYLKREIENC